MRKTPRRVEPHGGAPVVVWPVPYPNRFLGNQYTPVLTIRDQIRPREMFDRMVAVRFEVPLAAAQKSRKMTLTLHEVDGLESSTDVRLP